MPLKLPPFWVAAASPDPVTVTCAVESAVDPPGVYCTVMVQWLPGLITAPTTQLPPVTIENEDWEGPAVLVTVGSAVNVNGAEVPPLAVLVTVIVPVLTVLLAGVLVNAGDGAEIASVAPFTVKAPVRVLLSPFDPVTVTFLAVSPAPLAITRFAVTVVAVATILFAVTPAPDMVIPVVPPKFVPVSVTGTVVPCLSVGVGSMR